MFTNLSLYLESICRKYWTEKSIQLFMCLTETRFCTRLKRSAKTPRLRYLNNSKRFKKTITRRFSPLKYSKQLPSEIHEDETNEYVVTIKFACKIHYQNLESYLKKGSTSAVYPQQEIALIDLVYRQNKLSR